MSQYNTINSGTKERVFTVVARSSGNPITAGTVNYYLKATSGDNAGKWWRDSDQTWQASETANAMTHIADGHWEIDLTSSPFDNGIRYLEYVKESGDLHVPDARHLVCTSATATSSSSTTTTSSSTSSGTGLVAEAAADPRKVSVDGMSTEQHSIPDLIAAEQHAAGKAVGGQNPARALCFTRLQPGGTA